MVPVRYLGGLQPLRVKYPDPESWRVMEGFASTPEQRNYIRYAELQTAGIERDGRCAVTGVVDSTYLKVNPGSGQQPAGTVSGFEILPLRGSV